MYSTYTDITFNFGISQKKMIDYTLNISMVRKVCSAYNMEGNIYWTHAHVGPSSFPQLGFPFFGLDHVNRNPKRPCSIFEKAIKIHN